jgi:hypothetical protein
VPTKLKLPAGVNYADLVFIVFDFSGRQVELVQLLPFPRAEELFRAGIM